jgi:hypothetical protein
MVAPLIGIAAAAAARLAAKKLAQQAAKKAAKSAAGRARSNSAAAAKAVAPKPKKLKGPVKVLEPIKRKGPIKIDTNPSIVVKKPVRVTTPTAQQSIDAARKALGSTKPDPKALARRITQDKAREMERIRKQGRNTR